MKGEDEIILLAARGWPAWSIAHLTGAAINDVRAVMTARGFKGGTADHFQTQLSSAAIEVLDAEAEQRGTSRGMLARRILETVLAGGPKGAPMIAAVLDEGA